MQPNTKQWIIRFNEQVLFFLIILAGKDQEMVQMCYKYLTAYQMWRLRRKKGQKKISGLQDNAIKLPPAYKLVKNKLISKHANRLGKPPRSKCQEKPLGWGAVQHRLGSQDTWLWDPTNELGVCLQNDTRKLWHDGNAVYFD